MFEMTDVIVGLWFLPVTLFIIIPLLMLGGWLVFKLFIHLKARVGIPKKKDQPEDAAIQTKASRQPS